MERGRFTTFTDITIRIYRGGQIETQLEKLEVGIFFPLRWTARPCFWIPMEHLLLELCGETQ